MINKKNIFILAIVVLLIMILFTAYFLLNETKQTKKAIISKPVKKQTVQAQNVEIVFPAYSYDAEKLRDPFAPLIVRRQQFLKGTSPLENYDIEELKLTGIARDKKGSLALIQAPDGRFYIVRENDIIGMHKGRIIKIQKGLIEIKEDSKKVKYLKLSPEDKSDK